MDKVFKQVRAARRRLSWQMFFAHLAWTLLGALSIAAVAIGLHSRYPTRLDPWTFNGLAWAVGVFSGLLAAALWTWLARPTILATAAEIDRRFQLRERLSSSLALTPEEEQSEAGQALLADAISRAERIDVGAQFGVSLPRRLILPILPFCVALLLALVVQAWETPLRADPTAEQAQRKQVEKSIEDLRQRIEKRRDEAAEKGLQDTEQALRELHRGLREMKKRSAQEPKKELVELNKLVDQLAARREKLSGANKIRQQLQKMKGLKQGPADKVTQALKKGDLGEAAEQLEQLKQQAKDGKLDPQQKAKLAEQLEQMQQQLRQQAEAQVQTTQDLEQQLQQARQQGNQATAKRLQRQLDQFDQQQDLLQPLAQQLGQAAQALKQNQGEQAADALQQAADQLSQLQQQNDQLETLDGTLEDIQMAKDAMTCDQCQGAGCEKCHGGRHQAGPGQGQQQNPGQQSDTGQQSGQGQLAQQGAGQHRQATGQPGRGIGVGHVDSESDGSMKDAGFFDTQVRPEVRRGASAVVGKADGPNAKGQVHDAIQAEFESRDTGPADPLTIQRLPKSQRTHVEEYFRSLREGK